MFSLESPHRGDSNEYTHAIITCNIKKKTTTNYPKYDNVCNYGIFPWTQELVRNSRGKQPIGVRAIDVLLYIQPQRVGWLVGCFGFNGPFRQYFSLYRAVSQREGERGERIDESKNVQTTPPAPTVSAIGPCPTVIQIVGRSGTGSLPSTIAPPTQRVGRNRNWPLVK